MRPKLLVWDWNGTILDDMWLCYEIENQMLRERNMPEISDAAFYLDSFSFPIRDYYRALGYTFEQESYESLSVEFIDLYAKGFPRCGLRKGVEETLKTICEMQIPQTLLSATKEDRLIEQASHFGVQVYFDKLLGLTNDYAYTKVDRAKDYIREHGIDPKEVVFIGDTDHDYAAASGVGCRCILLTGGHQSRKVLERCGVPVLDSTDDLLSILSE